MVIKMGKKEYMTLEEFDKALNITEEQKAEIQLEVDIIQATIEVRKTNKLRQRDLSKLSGVTQPMIARMEKKRVTPNTSTLIKMLLPMGYTIRVVPLEESTVRE